MIVQEPRFVEECRQLQRLCNDSESWTTEMDERAVSLHEALCDHYGVDEAFGALTALTSLRPAPPSPISLAVAR